MHWLIKFKRFLGGAIERVRVSAHEHWDITYFIDYYLRRYRFEITDRNRSLLREIVNAYPGSNPPRQEDLMRFLDHVVTIANEPPKGAQAKRR